MKEFLRPTKRTWWVLLILIVLNIILPVSGIFLSVPELIFIPVFQAYTLSLLFINVGVKVCNGGDFICNPSFIGWLLMGLSVLSWIILYYFIASYISKKIIKSGRKDFSN
ncbi:MAG: hypothetical protein A2928_01650 [Candidatus Taylorbacteria bacterium RIFCSPLOWO2_01_FULL_45_15b]|uniref:Uncharacterized protein n=1 Tax=Candidatus Taylorbacteria bacterium RIFCSPLOWO2_01_FULL_45_15b TaxID=1802319 RepID=A0A1G2NB72_9BACT|nr:MAG: hypothetical protein A2928_01650 [Candidatus Taylorbacteria bacterium RIFCSPLOWO2_01_FULL_45_15b]